MAENVINLKKRESAPEEDRNPPSVSQEDNSSSPDMETEFYWDTKEYERKERSTLWHVAVGSIVFLLAVVGVLAKSYFFIAFLVLAFALYLYYALRRLPSVSILANEEGVTIGNKLYPYADLKSFWIFVRRDGSELSLETKSVLHAVITIPLKEVDIYALRDYLAHFVEEKEHVENFFDRVARRFGI